MALTTLEAAFPAALVAVETTEEVVEEVSAGAVKLAGSSLAQLFARSSSQAACPLLFPTVLAIQSSKVWIHKKYGMVFS